MRHWPHSAWTTSAHSWRDARRGGRMRSPTRACRSSRCRTDPTACAARDTADRARRASSCRPASHSAPRGTLDLVGEIGVADRHRGTPQGRAHRARPDRQPPSDPGRRPHVRVLQRRPRTHRRARGGLRPWCAVPRRGRHGQTLRRERHRDRADERRRRRRRTHPSRALPAPVRTHRERRPTPGGS